MVLRVFAREIIPLRASTDLARGANNFRGIAFYGFLFPLYSSILLNRNAPARAQLHLCRLGDRDNVYQA